MGRNQGRFVGAICTGWKLCERCSCYSGGVTSGNRRHCTVAINALTYRSVCVNQTGIYGSLTVAARAISHDSHLLLSCSVSSHMRLALKGPAVSALGFSCSVVLWALLTFGLVCNERNRELWNT